MAQFHSLKDSLNILKTPIEAKSVLAALTEKKSECELPKQEPQFVQKG